jgi:hypothetical protein
LPSHRSFTALAIFGNYFVNLLGVLKMNKSLVLAAVIAAAALVACGKTEEAAVAPAVVEAAPAVVEAAPAVVEAAPAAADAASAVAGAVTDAAQGAADAAKQAAEAAAASMKK